MEFVEFKINGMVGIEYSKKWNEIHSILSWSNLLWNDSFVFFVFIFGINRMSIPFHSCQMVNFFMELME